MKMIAGSCLRAIANSRRMRAAPRPANISTNDAADWAKNCAPDSCATALASSVLPVPGGPCSRMPLGTFAPSSWKGLGSRRNSTISCSSALASSTPAMSAKETACLEVGLDLLRLDARHHLQRAPQHEDDRGEEQDPHDRLPLERPVLDVCASEVCAARRPGGDRRSPGACARPRARVRRRAALPASALDGAARSPHTCARAAVTAAFTRSSSSAILGIVDQVCRAT